MRLAQLGSGDFLNDAPPSTAAYNKLIMSNKTLQIPQEGLLTLARCIEIITAGPSTPQAIGEALWQVDSRQLYLSIVSEMKVFLRIYTKLSLKKAARIIEEWQRSEQGRAVIGQQPVPDVEQQTQKRDAASTARAKTTTTAHAKRPPATPSPTGVISGKYPDAMTSERQSAATQAPTGSVMVPAGVATGSESSSASRRIVLKLSEITLDPRIQARAGVNKKTVAHYAERMKLGDHFPYLVVFLVEGLYLLVDGWHRFFSAEEAGLENFLVEIHEGTRKDAVAFAIKANHDHGLPRTNDDKRRSVELALGEFEEKSDRALAELCAVSQTLVSKVRKQLKADFSSAKRIGRDGKRRKLPKRQPAGDAKGSATASDEAQGKGATGGQENPDTTKESATENGKDSTAGGGGDTEEFRVGEAWQRIEMFLLAEHKSWPQEWHQSFGNKLRQFADEHCG